MFSMNMSESLENTCDCMPACTSLQYDAEISQGAFNWQKLYAPYVENAVENASYDGYEG